MSCFIVDWLSARATLGVMAFFMFLVTQMIRVNLYIAVIAFNETIRVNGTEFSEEASWNKDAYSVILGAFYWTYWATELPGGLLAQRYGGKKVLGLGVILAAITNLLLPVACKYHYLVASFLRAVQGLALGVTWPVIHWLSGRWIPQTERSKFMTSYHGAAIGSAISYPLSGIIITHYGWEFVFYFIGIITIIWSFMWWILVFDSPKEHPRLSDEESKYLAEAIGDKVNDNKFEKITTPWTDIIYSKPFWAVLVASQGLMWGTITLSMQTPAYFHQVHQLNIKSKTPILNSEDMLMIVDHASCNNSTSASEDETPPHVCCHCRLESSSLVELLEHQKDCSSKFRICNGDQSDPEDLATYGDDEEFCNDGEKRQEAVRRQRQDAENNNSVEGEENEKENDLTLGFPFSVSGVPGHVTLEALQNTKVAVAQFAATALATNGDNPAALQELAVLQSTLFTLQQQQMMQLSLIQQLQNHLTVHPKEERPSSPPPPTNLTNNPGIPVPAAPPVQQPSTKPIRIPTPVRTENGSVSPPTSESIPATHKQQTFEHQPLTIPKPPVPLGSPLQPAPPTSTHPPLCSISSTLASSIITNNDPPPSLNEPNTLEMLQKRAQEVLDNASQGLLANNLADELAFRKNGKNSLSPLSGGRNEPFFKHRCRYCGKVFGSDSALQIHIRSHTGERPFKCNVCGSRFTTKGNLKVHFQRHTSKFPHIKMNPNPVPEHLDKYHPPLLAQINNQNLTPGIPPHQTHPHPHRPSPHYPFAGSPTFSSPALPLFRAPMPHELIPRPTPVLAPLRSHEPNLLKPLITLPLFTARDEQDTPENLSKPQNRSASPLETGDYQETYKDRSRSHSPSLVKQEILERDSKDTQDKPKSDMKLEKMVLEDNLVKVEDDLKEKNFNEKVETVEKNETFGGDEVENSIKERLSPKKEVQSNCERFRRDKSDADTLSPHFDECSSDSKYSDEDILEENFERNSVDPEKLEEQPENLSSKSPEINQASETSSQRTLVKTTPFPHTVSPHSSNSSGSNNFSVQMGTGSNLHDIDPAKDPAIYNSLLPRPGSNDNSWESLIEVTKTSETYKLQQLVDNIEHKLTDPNQCVICHRVLSCKSALQMHYRTHTGERPFRCKICGRAFTTKGNLKTHMGVHRLKPPMRVLHQCPVCHKKFTNALVLQQHIRLHTGEPTDLTPEQIHAAEIKDYASSGPFPNPNFLSHGFPISGLPPTGIHLGIRPDFDKDTDNKDDQQDDEMFDEDDDEFSNSSESQPLHFPPFPSSISAIENQVRTITTMASHLSASELNHSAEDLSVNKVTSPPYQINGVKSPGTPSPGSPNDADFRVSPSPPPKVQTPLNIPRPPSSRTPSSPANSESNSLGALDLTPRTSTIRSSPGPPQTGIFSSLGLIPSGGSSNLMTSALSSLTSSVLTSTAFSPLGMAVGPAVRGNTTCNICFKTFACNSALEIHYRSHTKERPFKCSICDRGFSTKNDNKIQWCKHQWRIQNHSIYESNDDQKNLSSTYYGYNHFGLPLHGYVTDWMHTGNMKQHMLTHKIRDMPAHLFENKKSPTIGNQPQVPSNNQSEEISEVSSLSNSNSAAAEDSKIVSSANVEIPESPPGNVESENSVSIKRSPTENDLPIPKRQPSMPKHLCHVCNKNFSSSSALQIHMRTHTGDKPFRCSVCQKAFTTKGNLKVHMGTHMWSNGASRRGRRMSLDLPPIPMNPKDSEFLQRRPDLFYPYLPTPFLNGVQQKLSEMSAIQSGNHHPNNGLLQSSSKFGNILSFGNFGNVEKSLRSSSRSPPGEKQSPELPHLRTSPTGGPPVSDDMPRGVWDPYFERKVNNNEESIQVSSPPAGNLPPPPAQRGEGLAA